MLQVFYTPAAHLGSDVYLYKTHTSHDMTICLDFEQMTYISLLFIYLQHYYTNLLSIIILFQALKHYTNSLGWVLLEINSNGEIECVTENIKDLILQERTELHKRSIFSLLHANDHAKLRPLLRNIQTFGWGAGETDKFQAIQARILVKNPNGTESSGYVSNLQHIIV